MSDIIDITVQETIDLVDITVTPNIIEVNVTRTSGGGAGSQTLAQTLDLGNSTGGENILVNNADAIELENTSLLKKGTYDFGGNGGISRVCSNQYEDMWQNGFRHVFDQSGFIRTSSNGFDAIPDSSFDVTLRFKVGSFWTLDDGSTYVCIDNTEGAAVWELYVTNVPTLQQVLDNNKDLVDGNFFAGTSSGDNNTGNTVIAIGESAGSSNSGIIVNALGEQAASSNSGTEINAFGNLAAFLNEGNYVNSLGSNAATGNLANYVNAFGSGAGSDNAFNHVQLLGQNAQADENGQTVLSKDGTIMARISTTDLTASRKYTLQDADGTIAFLSDITGGGVPYTGATEDLNLGEFGLLTGNIEFDNTPTNIPTTAGSMVWNDTDGTVDLILKGGNVTLQIGQENVLRVVNKTATNINLLEANYQAVRVTGAQGQRLKVDLAQATTDALSAETIGLVTETINNNEEGFITTSGLIRNINTTGSLQSETWADGDILYLSPTVAGRVTKVKPTAPNHLIIVGYVVSAHATQGSIFVKVDNGYELNELHNVSLTSETNNQLLAYTSATELWQNKNLIDILEDFNKTKGIYFFEEFMGNQGGGVTTSFGGLITTATGTGASCITTGTITNRTNQQGVVRAQTGTTLTGQAGFLYGGVNLFRGMGTVSIETYVTIETLSTSTERFFTIFGHIGVANYTNPANGIFFTYDEGGVIGGFANAGSPNFKCVAINTLTRTFFTSSVPVVAGQWYKLRIDLNASGTQASYFIDGNLITTLTTNIPATTTAMGIHSVIVKTVGVTTRAMQTDYFTYEEIFTNPR
jgi:hypothetical protein